MEFQRIKRLPPYVFNIVNELKAQARQRGEDVVDFGMGNPDQPTPQHIVDKLIEAARRGDTHRYSVSKGIPRLRRAICAWYKRRYDVDLDPDSEAIVTIGSKEGLWRTSRSPRSARATPCWCRTRPTRSTPTAL
ncbi:MAG: aminotransferase class I/II-fold pyridoxal phosphate-dependent enzyme [Candidatus Manganitrophus sp.]|nr:MAG: aminotransferase class I/II-fold pyridoxal phosphate-dependent enzyme [Candidatus Manganitrophus sp.]